MTPDVRLGKVERSLMITARLRRASDRRWRQRLRKHDARMRRMREIVTSLAPAEQRLSCKPHKLHGGTDARLKAVSKKLEELADGQEVTWAKLDGLRHNIDRFLRSQRGNRRRTKGGRH